MTGALFRRLCLHPLLAPEERPAAPRGGPIPFQAHVELLGTFLGRRGDIVERIERVLNARRKPVEYLQDGPLLSRHFDDCFFTAREITDSQSGLRGQLEQAHWASGFKPRDLPGLHNSLIDPAEMMIRAFHMWRQTHWPGRAGRLHYAHTLFNLYVMRCLALLSMRVWDEGPGSAGDRLSDVQRVLDDLWKGSPSGQPALVRDARWLIQLAQSPATDDLGPYFEVARHIADSFGHEDRLEIHKAGVRMAGGHLRSQLHYYAVKNAVPLNDDSLVLSTRSSNALDFALLIQELVPLLEAYEDACRGGDGRKRLELADAILQGLSPDPELFLNHVEVLGAYSMIEHLFVTTGPGGDAVYTPMGRRHVQLFQEYMARIDRVAKPLAEDGPHFRPVPGAYSPYGILYGFSFDLVEHMALKTLQREPATPFSLEDVFEGGASGAEKLAWVSGWRKLPHVTREVQKRFEYPQTFAEEAFDRVERALRRRTAGSVTDATGPAGRLYVIAAGDGEADADTSSLADLPPRYIAASDVQVVSAQKAHVHNEPQLLSERREGRYVVSYRTPGGWVAIKKTFLTEVLAAGRDVKVAGLPTAAARALTLMCPGLAVRTEYVPRRENTDAITSPGSADERRTG